MEDFGDLAIAETLDTQVQTIPLQLGEASQFFVEQRRLFPLQELFFGTGSLIGSRLFERDPDIGFAVHDTPPDLSKIFSKIVGDLVDPRSQILLAAPFDNVLEESEKALLHDLFDILGRNSPVDQIAIQLGPCCVIQCDHPLLRAVRIPETGTLQALFCHRARRSVRRVSGVFEEQRVKV